MISCKDGIIGLAIGDALGVPWEFVSRSRFQRAPVEDMIGYCMHNVPAGTWSDDTSMTLATINAIIEKRGFDSNTIGENFVRWFRNAEFCAIDRIFDAGGSCIRAIAKFELKQDIAENCGGADIMDNGNGSLMRILPIAYYLYSFYEKSEIMGDDFEKIFEIVRKTSSITHKHEISIMACVIYVIFAISLMLENSIEYSYQLIQNLNYKKWFNDDTISKFDRILKDDIIKLDITEIKSTGYVVDTLEASLWSLMNTTNYNDAVLKAVNLGGDTDTIGACTGGLAGIYYGIDSIKPEWKNTLLKYDYIIELCEKFDGVLKLGYNSFRS